MAQKFRIQVILNDGKIQEEFTGEGDDSYREILPFARKIAGIYNGKVYTRIRSEQFIVGRPFPSPAKQFLKDINFEYDDYTLTFSELCGLLERYKHQ